jgi:exonuclease III
MQILKTLRIFFVPNFNFNNVIKNTSLTGCTMDISKFRILHQNIAGLCKKIDLLELTLHELQQDGRDVDILCFSESFVGKGKEANIKLDNYKLGASFCRNKNRGGTCILVKNAMEIKQMQFPSNLVAQGYFECCGIEMIGLNIIIIVIYRIPQQTSSHIGVFIHKLDTLLNYLTSKYRRKRVIVCGDWNINVLVQNKYSTGLLSVLHSYNFDAHITSPTRINSCLDQIASNMKTVECEVLYLSLSDHETAQMLTLNINKQKSFSTWFEFRRDYAVENVEKFLKCIAALSFSDVLQCTDAVKAFEYFYEMVCLLYNLCFPNIRVKMNNRPSKIKWLTKGLKVSCRNKRKLYNSYKVTRNNTELKKQLHGKAKKYNYLLRKCITVAQ